MENNSDNSNLSNNELMNSNLLKRTVTNTANALKRTFTVSNSTITSFSNNFEFDDNIAIKDLSTSFNTDECNIWRRLTK